jgi:hypothetical protein
VGRVRRHHGVPILLGMPLNRKVAFSRRLMHVNSVTESTAQVLSVPFLPAPTAFEPASPKAARCFLDDGIHHSRFGAAQLVPGWSDALHALFLDSRPQAIEPADGQEYPSPPTSPVRCATSVCAPLGASLLPRLWFEYR